MKEHHPLLSDPRMTQAVETLRAQIAERYPTATFEVFHRDDPDGVRLRATVDLPEPSQVMDVVIDTLYEYQVEQELPVYVVAVQPLERVAEQLRSRSRRPEVLPPLP